MKPFQIFIIIALLAVAAFACKDAGQEADRVPVAKVFDKYLYEDDLEGIIAYETTAEDSAIKLSNYIHRWIKKQLIIKKAELNLTAEQKDVERELQEYRESLLIHMYQDKVIRQDMDTLVTEQEILSYYDQNAGEFRLAFNVVKATLIKVLKNKAVNRQFKYLYRSSNERDRIKLEDLANEEAEVFTDYKGEWIEFSKLLEDVPAEIADREAYLKSNRHIETADSLFSYYVNINDYRLVNDTMPLVFIRSNIKSIILTKRRMQLIREIEENIYNNALENNNFKIYKDY